MEWVSGALVVRVRRNLLNDMDAGKVIVPAMLHAPEGGPRTVHRRSEDGLKTVMGVRILKHTCSAIVMYDG